MASQGYRDWVAAGKPFTLAAPLKTLRDILRGYGYTVYDIGNEQHQLATPPEDHMPYSETGWPRTSPRWFGFALDIMPPPSGSGLPSLPKLLGQMHRDKMASHPGLAWLKYMNWEPSGPSGPCYHDSWQPGHARRDSSDRGHGHLSGRSDHYLTDTSGGYDPVARLRGEDDEMSPYVQHVMNYRLAAVVALRDVVNVPKSTFNGVNYPAFSEPNVLALTIKAQSDPDVDETKLAELLAPVIRDIFADLDTDTPADGLTEDDVRAAVENALNRARIAVTPSS